MADPRRGQGQKLAQGRKQELDPEQKRIGDGLVRGLLLVIVLAAIAEFALRVYVPRGATWLEWLAVSLIGVCAYLLSNVAFWYHREGVDFKAHRPWYIATATRGPLIALAVLVALTNIKFTGELASTFDFGVDFGNASEAVLLVAAFLLGFYSRLARDILEKIASFIFGSIYKETYKQEIKAEKEAD
jgi:hypothetical protein